MICLEIDTVLFSLNERKGKFLERTLEPTEDFANIIYQGSAEIFIYLMKKNLLCCKSNTRKKKCYMVSILILFLITKCFHLCPRSICFPLALLWAGMRAIFRRDCSHPHFPLTEKSNLLEFLCFIIYYEEIKGLYILYFIHYVSKTSSILHFIRAAV